MIKAQAPEAIKILVVQRSLQPIFRKINIAKGRPATNPKDHAAAKKTKIQVMIVIFLLRTVTLSIGSVSALSDPVFFLRLRRVLIKWIRVRISIGMKITTGKILDFKGQLKDCHSASAKSKATEMEKHASQVNTNGGFGVGV